MSSIFPPRDPAAQLQWLVDRALISDLLVTMARTLDERDGAGYAALFVEDGVMELGEMHVRGRPALAAGVLENLGGYAAVWHLSSNHAIEIDGDRALVVSYVIGVHRHGDDLTHHADMAGWYDMRLVRTDDGWLLAAVSSRIVWLSGDGALPHE